MCSSSDELRHHCGAADTGDLLSRGHSALVIARGINQDQDAKWMSSTAGADIDAMAGLEFEQCVGVMFTRLGYHVQLTETYDFGADLIVTKDGTRTAVQAKRQSAWVGDTAVQQAVTGRTYYDGTTASVITNAEVQPRTRGLAAKVGVTILDRVHLTRMLQMAGMIASPQLLEPGQCRRCELTLVSRTSRFGPFWGCANYPRGCRSRAQYQYSLIVATAAAVFAPPAAPQVLRVPMLPPPSPNSAAGARIAPPPVHTAHRR